MTEQDSQHLPEDAAWLPAPVRRALLEVTLFVLAAILDPFGVVGWSEMRSHDFWQRINADNYPPTDLSFGADHKKTTPPVRSGRDAITVVYFDDASVKRQYGAAGMTSFALLDLIDDIDLTPATPPKAIFVDMMLDDAGPEGLDATKLLADALGKEDDPASSAGQCAQRRSTDASSPISPFRCLVMHVAQLTQYRTWRPFHICQESTLAKLRCIRAAGGLPLIFADVSTQLQKDRRFDDLPRSAASIALGTVAALSPATIDVNAYPLVTPAKAADRSDAAFQLYPAAALYAVWCMNNPCQPPPNEHDRSRRPSWSSSYEKPLQVAWGIGPAITDAIGDPTHLLVARQTAGKSGEDFTERCTPADPGRWGDFKHLVRMSLSGLLRDRPSCLYARAVPSDIFQSASLSKTDADALVANKLVLIGAQFRASTDYVAAAPFGAVPGVYLHAMALDNLIEAGSRYQSAPTKVLGDFATSDLLNVVVLFFVAYVLARARIDLKAIETAEQFGNPVPRPHLGRLRIVLTAAGITLAFWIVILALTRLPLIGIHVIPDNINAAAAMLLALFGLLDLMLEGIKPLLNAIRARILVAIKVLFRGERPADTVANTHGQRIETGPGDPSQQNGG